MRAAVRSERVLIEGTFRAACVVIENKRIADVIKYDALDNTTSINIKTITSTLLPKLVDTHIHINEPGRTDWEGFETATRAAAAGGVTTLINMPLNCIPVTTSRAALETKLETIHKLLAVDIKL
jgi:allantoinase